MTVSLELMEAGAIDAFLARSRAAFIADLVASGLASTDASRQADASVQAAFPNARPAPGHLLYDIMDGDQRRGHLWLGPDPSGIDGRWWVWDIEVDERARRSGIGRSAMMLAADEAKRRGGHEIGLNVFGKNAGARRLYESLGYEVMSFRMRKRL